MSLFHSAYKTCVAPFLGENCRFYPSCSDYCKDAVIEHGFVKGLALSIGRIVRCQPLCTGGIDPVPQKRKV